MEMEYIWKDLDQSGKGGFFLSAFMSVLDSLVPSWCQHVKTTKWKGTSLNQNAILVQSTFILQYPP